MLKVLRENVKYLSWILWLVIGIFVLFVFVDFGGFMPGGGAPRSMAARVGSETVTVAEFQSQYRQTEERLRQLYGEQFSPDLARQMRLPVRVLDDLVNRKIMLEEARRLGLGVTDGELRKAILEVPVFKDDKGRFVGDATYAEILKANNRTIDRFESEMREELLLGKLQKALVSNIYVSDQEVERSYRDQTEKAKIRYLQLPRNRYLQGEQIPEAEIRASFEAGKEKYRLPEQREVAYVLVEAGKMLEAVKVDEAEIRRYYDEHKAEFSQEEQVRARHILVMVNDQKTDAQAKAEIEAAQRRLQGGEDFAKVAREVSEDTASKEQGGDLGLFGRNRMVKEFEEAAFGAQPGQLVGPVKSQFGYHLLEVQEKRAGGTRPYEEAKLQIQARLSGERVRTVSEQKAQQVAAQLKSSKPKDPAAVEAFAKKDPTLSFAKSGRFGQQDPVPGLGLSPQLSAAAFALEKGQVSDPVQVARGWAVLFLQEVHPSRLPELSEVEPRVRLALAAEKQQQRAMTELERAKQAVAQGKTLDQVAAELGLEVKTSEEFGGQGTIPGLGFNPQLAQAALTLPQGQVGGPVADAQGAVLFQVVERKGWNQREFQTKREETRTTLVQERLGRLLAALLEQRRRELGVEYDRELLQGFGIVGEEAGTAG
jgi:peptidyl-prolyl cis-trans isomerase D